jgi:hypothetical protein
MDEDPLVGRREALELGAGLAAAGALAGCSTPFTAGDDAATTGLADERGRELAERFAPTYLFDEYEQWFPTDPRPYAEDGEVGGFAALDGYTRRRDEAGAPPDPTVFYRGIRYEDSPLAVVSFWWYAAFDQFATNFHWHDWEVTHAFVDLDDDEPVLYVGSAHSQRVPDNEFLDPETEQPRVLSELGSHSTALSVNDAVDRFDRFPPAGGSIADITNSALDALEGDLPAAYGLPRDEGRRLPYSVPELDGAPLPEHERLPNVDPEDLLDPAVTVRSFSELAEPPGSLPERENGTVFGPGAGEAAVEPDVTYALEAIEDLETIESFTGPQLSFEFPVPQFAENAIAGHISTAGTPWKQERYDNPAADVSDPAHRATLASRYDAVGEPAPLNRVVAAIRGTEPDPDAPDGEGVQTVETDVESVALLESDPAAVPTFRGVALVDGAEAGDHRLTVAAAGRAPYSEGVRVADDEAPTTAGVDGEVAIPPGDRATKLEIDADGTDADLERAAVVDDFGGRLYDAPIDGPDAVYVDGAGAYAAEVRDADDEVGAFRVNPADGERVRVDRPDTGARPLAAYVADVATETAALVQGAADGEDDDTATPGSGGSGKVGGLARALEAVADAAARAAERAEQGDRGGTDRALENVRSRLAAARERLADARDELPAEAARAVERRADGAERRAEQAADAGKL